jgi:hypothetical protein
MALSGWRSQDDRQGDGSDSSWAWNNAGKLTECVVPSALKVDFDFSLGFGKGAKIYPRWAADFSPRASHESDRPCAPNDAKKTTTSTVAAELRGTRDVYLALDAVEALRATGRLAGRSKDAKPTTEAKTVRGKQLNECDI